MNKETESVKGEAMDGEAALENLEEEVTTINCYCKQ